MGYFLKLLLTNLIDEDDDLGGILIFCIGALSSVIGGLFSFVLSLVPIILVVLLPIILFAAIFGVVPSYTTTPNTPKYNQEVVKAYYDNAPLKARNEIDSWIQSIINQNPADDYVINDNFSVDANLLMSIDAVRYNQDFSKSSESKVNDLCSKLYTKSYYTETYQVTETYTELKYNEDGTTELDENGNQKTEVITKTVDKKRLVINISMNDIASVCKSIGLNDEQINHVYFMLENANTMLIEAEKNN